MLSIFITKIELKPAEHACSRYTTSQKPKSNFIIFLILTKFFDAQNRHRKHFHLQKFFKTKFENPFFVSKKFLETKLKFSMH